MVGYIGSGTRKYRAMRVIGGTYRGRPLRSLRGMAIRPTSDRLRETLFNVLTAGNPEALAGTVWLDLFAGTGAVGIEALSRGAKQAYFVETSAPAAKLLLASSIIPRRASTLPKLPSEIPSNRLLPIDRRISTELFRETLA